MLALAERPEGAWRPPIVKTVASRGEGLDEVVAEIDRHHAWLAESGELDRAPRTPRPRRDRGDRRHRAAGALGRRPRPQRARRPRRRGRRRRVRPLHGGRRAARGVRRLSAASTRGSPPRRARTAHTRGVAGESRHEPRGGARAVCRSSGSCASPLLTVRGGGRPGDARRVAGDQPGLAGVRRRRAVDRHRHAAERPVGHARARRRHRCHDPAGRRSGGQGVVAVLLAVVIAWSWVAVSRGCSRVGPGCTGHGGCGPRRAYDRLGRRGAGRGGLRATGMGLLPPLDVESFLLLIIRNYSGILGPMALGSCCSRTSPGSASRAAAGPWRAGGPAGCVGLLEVAVIVAVGAALACASSSPRTRGPSPSRWCWSWSGRRSGCPPSPRCLRTGARHLRRARDPGRARPVPGGRRVRERRRSRRPSSSRWSRLPPSSRSTWRSAGPRRPRARSAEQVAESRATLFSTVIDNLDEGVTVITGDDDYTVRNRAARRLTGAAGSCARTRPIRTSRG